MEYNFVSGTIETTDGTEYIVEYPDLKACGGCGKTFAEALAMAEENKAIYIEEILEEGKPLPKAVFNVENEYSGKFTTRISPKLHRDAVIYARNQGISLSSLMTEALTSYIGRGVTVMELIHKLNKSIDKGFASQAEMIKEESDYIKKHNIVIAKLALSFGRTENGKF